MQRPIPATTSLPYKQAKSLLKGIRANLKYRGLTRSPYDMCAEMDEYGRGWAVFVGFQPGADVQEALAALHRDYPNPLDFLNVAA